MPTVSVGKGREYLTPEQAEKLLPEGDTIHVFLNPGGMLVGADWSRERVTTLIKGAEYREVGGEQCVRMGHGMVVFHDGRNHFVESRAGK